MVTTVEEIDGKLVVTLEGEMDTVAVMDAEEILKPLYNTGGKDIVIECGKLVCIASSGLRIFLSILRGATDGGYSVTLRHVNEEIKMVFNMTGFIKIFNFE